MPYLHVVLVPDPGRVVVRLAGDAGEPTADRLADALRRAAGMGVGSVVVDVAGLRFQDTAGLRVLSAFTAALASAGRGCRVVGAPAATRRLVRTAGFGDELELDGPLDGNEPVCPGRRAPATEVVRVGALGGS